MSDITRLYYITNRNRKIKVTVCPQLGCSFEADKNTYDCSRQETANILRLARIQMASIKKIGVLL